MEQSEQQPQQQQIKKPGFDGWYDRNYKILLVIPFILLFMSVAYVIFFAIQTGDIIHKDVTLTGGTTLTIYTESPASGFESSLKAKFNDISVRTLTDLSTGKQLAITIETQADSEELKKAVSEALGYELTGENSSVEFTGASLSKSFYKELIIAILLAFAFMSIVVFLIFKLFLPSIYVVLCAFTDIMIPLAIIDLFGVRLSTAGIAAFLMLIGYSVDTDILLTTKALRRKEENPLNERLKGAFKTGITMTVTSLVAVSVAYFIVFSPVLKEVFLVLILGLIVDILGTWLMNASLVKWYCESRGIQ